MRETQKQLIERAGMTGPEFNTSVVRATDAGPRISVSGAMLDPKWGDCVVVGFMNENESFWRYSHLSPARARILAAHLLRIAEMKEQRSGGRIRIDPPPHCT